MAFWRRLIGGGQSKRGDQARRVVVVVLNGLDPELVDRYLEQGLLHHIALLGDIGSRTVLAESHLDTVASLAGLATANRLQPVVLPAIPIDGKIDLHSICVADRVQQERLIAALSRRRPQIVVAGFDMPLQLTKLFGANPQPDECLILRDVYARMDEVVGKAFSFVDDSTVLLAVIPGGRSGDAAVSETTTGLLYASRPLRPQSEAEGSVAQLALQLLGVAGAGD